MNSTLTTKLTAGAAAGGLALGALLGLAGPANAADTVATFSITAGSLSISAPATATFSSVASGAATAGGQLGAIQVTDTRGALTAAWSTTVATTEFSAGTSANEKVATTNIAYVSGARTGTGTGTFVPGVLANGAGPTWAGVGNNSGSWNPTLTLTLLGSQVAGTYTGTVTHSIA